MDKKIIKILTKLYNVVREEENGSAEHISEYFSSKELEAILKENNVQVGSNLTDGEIDEAIKDFLEETKMKFFQFSIVAEWLDKTDMNEEAREKFVDKLMKII